MRNSDVDRLLEAFLVSAAVAFLGIRIYLALTDYPQLGGHGLHIAHMLWGGLLMLVAMVLTLSFLGGHVRLWAAIIGGLGFGTFIDELGKFITSDNDYFFQPTIALIYAIFVILYLVFQAIGSRQSSEPGARLARALDATTTAAVSGFEARDRQRALALLAEDNPADPVARSLREGLAQVEARPSAEQLAVLRLAGTVRDSYDRVIRQPWFPSVVIVLMALQVASGLASVTLEITLDPEFSLSSPALSIGDVIKVGGEAVSDLLIVIGLISLRRSRLDAYLWLKRAVLLSLLLVQFFSFYESELTAAWGLLYNLVLLGALNFSIRRERERKDADISAVPEPAMAQSRA